MSSLRFLTTNVVRKRSCNSILKTLTKCYGSYSTITPDGVRDPGPSSWTGKLEVVPPDHQPILPTYRVMDQSGKVVYPDQDPNLGEEMLLKMYSTMVTLNSMDKILYDAQRQGRISFYMTSFGEEATHIGSAAAINDDDLVYAQYRETGVLMWRGYTLDQFMNQCYGNVADKGKGKQMPIHYGSKDHHFITISSPLSTQMPQAVGSAYAFKNDKSGRCAIVYFGDGAASEGDAHAAFNFSATLSCPIIFFCRNNGYAISTSVEEQYRGDGIAGRGAGYGMAALRVDGNDLLAVYQATKLARSYVVENNKPIILEAMTYRVGHHSTSDDSSTYRPSSEVEAWTKHDNPITRLRLYLEGHGWWNEDKEKELQTSVRAKLLKSFAEAEKKLKPPIKELFTDVYHNVPHNLVAQMQEMENHIKKYSENYPKNFAS